MLAARLTELREHVQAVEEAYEFMLAYAAQGLRSHRESPVGMQLRAHLERSILACRRLPDALKEAVEELSLEPAAAYEGFVRVLKADAERARAVLELVLAQPDIGSQLIDNLNAVIHVRSLLTDVFVIDEVLDRLSAGAALETA
ncbi:MAG TPA: hypothetical protein VIK98_01975 [Limnochordales bacterium]